MNFLELRQRVENELAHYPDNAGHREDLRVVINRVYTKFCDERQWPFMVHKCPIYAMPDYVIPNPPPVGETAPEIAPGYLDGRTLHLPRFDGRLWPVEDGNQFRQLEQLLTGAELTLADMSLRDEGGTLNNWELAPFTIEHVISSIQTAGPLVQLDPRAAFAGALSVASGNLLLKFPRILLPAEVESVLAIRTDTGQELRALMPQEQRQCVLEDRHSNGTPGWMLEDHGAELRHPPYIDTTLLNQPARSPFVYERETWPMREVITASVAAGAGNIAGGKRIRVFCCWWWSGRFGPPTNIVEVDTAAGVDTYTLSVTGYPTLPTTSANIEFGRRVAIFVAFEEEAFFLRAFVNNPATLTFTFTTDNTNNGLANMGGTRFPRYDELYPGGPYQYLRIWPRPSTMMRLELEYVARPREMIEDTDSPEFAGKHDVLVWLTVAELLASPRYNGDQAQIAGAMGMAETYRRPLLAKYMPNDRYKLVRGQVDRPRPRHYFIGPVIDYLG